jgi:eukaryotic-like serine/threonine-protein kinase
VGKTPLMPSTSSPDLIAGRYRIDSVLGRGGMGEVRAGTDLRLHRDVAVKLLRADLSDQAGLRARFEREARAAARISHPNVVAVFDIGEHLGVPYIVMERLPGGTLAQELAGGTLSQARACALVLEVLSALEAAHRLGVLHRDIKPSNILRGHDGHAKVADFGIAKVAEDPDPGTTGILFGTAAYLAPERLAGEPATPATDLYSVGVVLFEALAGRPPFRADTPLGLVQSIAGDSPPPLGVLRPDVESAVIAVTEQAMAKDPGRRFPSASAMATALTAAIAAPGATEGAPTVPVAAARTVRRAADPAPIEATQVLASPPPASETPRPSRRSGRRAKQWIAGGIALVVTIAILLAVLASGGGDPGPSQPTSTTQTSGSTAIPAPLRRAIDRLDQAVQP